MGDKVQDKLEETLDELNYYRRRKQFSEEEIQNIVRQRKDYEYKLQKNERNLNYYLQYIQFEMNLDLLRSKRVKRQKLYLIKKKNEDYAVKNRQYILIKRTLNRFCNDVILYKKFFNFYQELGNKEQAQNICTIGIKRHPLVSELWYQMILLEFYGNQNIKNTRMYFQLSLRFNPKCKMLWQEFFTIEMRYIGKILTRKYLLYNNDTNYTMDISTKELLSGIIPMTIFRNALQQVIKNINEAAIDYTDNDITNDINFLISFIKRIDEWKYFMKVPPSIQSWNIDIIDDGNNDIKESITTDQACNFGICFDFMYKEILNTLIINFPNHIDIIVQSILLIYRLHHPDDDTIDQDFISTQSFHYRSSLHPLISKSKILHTIMPHTDDTLGAKDSTDGNNSDGINYNTIISNINTNLRYDDKYIINMFHKYLHNCKDIVLENLYTKYIQFQYERIQQYTNTFIQCQSYIKIFLQELILCINYILLNNPSNLNSILIWLRIISFIQPIHIDDIYNFINTFLFINNNYNTMISDTIYLNIWNEIFLLIPWYNIHPIIALSWNLKSIEVLKKEESSIIIDLQYILFQYLLYINSTINSQIVDIKQHSVYYIIKYLNKIFDENLIYRLQNIQNLQENLLKYPIDNIVYLKEGTVVDNTVCTIPNDTIVQQYSMWIGSMLILTDIPNDKCIEDCIKTLQYCTKVNPKTYLNLLPLLLHINIDDNVQKNKDIHAIIERAINNFGSICVDIWLTYIDTAPLFSHVQQNRGDIYQRALNTLLPTYRSEFVARYC